MISTRRSCSATGRGHAPVAGTDGLGVGTEVWQLTGVEGGLALAPLGQTLLAAGLDRPVQRDQQGKRSGRQQLRLAGDLGGQRNAGRGVVVGAGSKRGGSHVEVLVHPDLHRAPDTTI